MPFVKTLPRLAILFATLLPALADAALGAAPTGVASAPRSLLAAPQPAATHASYSVHESHTADDVRVREYVLPDNVVFAVTWQGPMRPDMNELLGSYFPNFANPASNGNGGARPQGGGALIQGNGDFRLESFGRRGHFYGRAYLPRLVPTGMSFDDLQ
ncbi:DUF2844 domain-containing protein [Paraburkholderia sp. DHOC27]|uniref:DUF2844 domain-containing protein n=1 Tax=Paraburkholderia sp. DHOC27 TaxID=2303330 RepID=UPI000E3C4F9B|nr:DUF2844 domain-containing protein [Paraburkholderia sp. DHOC27]RFU46062.1 DUF2844 domain-containing protein [Paraburkholderia sp. DHOC27]